MMTESADVLRLHGPGTERFVDEVVVEEPLEIRVEGRSLAVTMRTPGHDAELAAGFLLSEGVISRKSDLFDIVRCPSADSSGNVVDAVLADPAIFAPEKFTRHVFSSASCGICGRATLEQLGNAHPAVASAFSLDRAALFALPSALEAAQSAFQKTGGIHAAALFDCSGAILEMREDVGRHNAVDKLLGWALLGGRLPLDQAGLLVSGRVSFEIVQKARAGGI
ncbi:MAG TPA: formate dehydrogenase accessory sulfurtransferase FdhD, partial [Terrimicrobiaceae bacterium]|nr:formate dehydrogenase accessory sulfurtransferase FdhD [Terrimicrobiaceae bacterium]